jgi:hypothetical protein
LDIFGEKVIAARAVGFGRRFPRKINQPNTSTNSLMKRLKTCTLFMLLTAATALPSFAQDAAPAKSADDKPNDAQMMTMMMDLAKPGENHKVLEPLVGTWTYTTKLWLSPDTNTPPMEYSGKAVAKSIMGGRYIQTDNTSKMQMPGADGTMMDMDFHGMEIAGYDNAKKKFVSSWVDNMGTGIMLSEGTYDPATKTITYTSEEEPMPGMKMKVRELLKLTDGDHHTFELYEDHGDGKETKAMEIVCVRDK